MFAAVAAVRSDKDLRFFRSLGVPDLALTWLKAALLTHPEISLDERVALIVGLLRNRIPADAFTSALFLDSLGNGVKDGARVFIAPAASNVFELPDWLDIRFLNEEMQSKLAAQLGTRDNRDQQQRLAAFGLVEYSLASLIGALVSAANNIFRTAPERADELLNELLLAVFRLYLIEGRTSKRPDYPDSSPVRLLNQQGIWALANNLYLGSGFGPQGEIVQALYEPWAPEKLVMDPDVLALTSDEETLKGFLIWIGVAEWPRPTVDHQPAPGYLDYLLREIRYAPHVLRSIILIHLVQLNVPQSGG
jgi:hypothetical protein